MTTQDSREFFYFKVPEFVVDLSIHLLIFYVLSRVLSVGMHAGIPMGDRAVYALLMFAFCISFSIMLLKLHERRIRLRHVL